MKKVAKTELQWKELLTPTQFDVCRKKGTEQAFTGVYYNSKEEGVYLCTCCKTALFSSSTKFDSGTGWPSYFKPIDESVITEHKDTSYGMVRIEVVCSVCDAHLGHLFNDGPAPTGLRYCINSVSLDFQKK